MKKNKEYSKLLLDLEKEKLMSYKELKSLIIKCQTIFVEEPNIIELTGPCVIVGDIHGQFHDLLTIFEKFDPSQNKILFLGDYVDRGVNSLECLLYLLVLKIMYPQNIILLRGNHESRQISQMDFQAECEKKFPNNSNIWRNCCTLFDSLPLCALINKKFFCVHGGLSPNINTLDQIRCIQRKREIPVEGIFCDLLWSDPAITEKKWGMNQRGAGYCFGSDVVNDFCVVNGLKFIIRAHQVMSDGFRFHFEDKKCLTVFSAPNYCYRFANKAAYATVDNGDVTVTQYEAKYEQHKISRTRTDSFGFFWGNNQQNQFKL